MPHEWGTVWRGEGAAPHQPADAPERRAFHCTPPLAGTLSNWLWCSRIDTCVSASGLRMLFMAS